MGKLLFFITMLVFIDVMFLLFINPVSTSLQSALFNIVVNSAGNIETNETGSGVLVQNNFFCNKDSLTISSLLSNASGICGTGTLMNALIRGLFIAAAVAAGTGAISFLARGSINITDLAWVVVGVFFFFNIGLDWFAIYNYISLIHPPFTKILGILFLVPLGVIYFFIAVEWMRGKD